MGSLGIKFWGTRGLISSPRPETSIFGGNTPCVQILYKDHLILVDTGFGCTNLGDELMDRILQKKEDLTIHILYTHFHWDHVQGLPFFKPIYFKNTTINLYSPEPEGALLENLNILFDGSYSPFESLLTMPAAIKLHSLTAPLELDGLKIEFKPVDHSLDASHKAACETYAYKFTAPDGQSVALITDHEARSSAKNKALVQFAKDVDVLIHDGQYFEEEYANHVGWGHSSAKAALENAIKIGSKLTLLTHHDPAHNDKDLQALHRALMKSPKFRPLNFEFARENVVYDVALLKSLQKAS
jgi:phosphoribosyl 1,2-cyclic phosphodiesterase